MRLMLMRSLLFSLVVFAWAMPGLAAQTFVVPITVVPGSVSVNVPGGPFPSQSLPSSHFFDLGGPCSVSGTLSIEVVDNGIEVELDVVTAGSDCSLEVGFSSDIEFVVPELGGTVTMVRIVGTPLTTNFPVIRTVFARMAAGAGNGFTSSVPGIFDVSFVAIDWLWQGTANDYPRPPGVPQKLVALIPGDTVLVPINANLRTDDGSPYTATIRMRYEFLVTVPEPSAALSLPIGVLSLAGLAAMKGGA